MPWQYFPFLQVEWLPEMKIDLEKENDSWKSEKYDVWEKWKMCFRKYPKCRIDRWEQGDNSEMWTTNSRNISEGPIVTKEFKKAGGQSCPWCK